MPTEKRSRQRAARQAKLAQQARTRRRRRLARNGAIAVVLAVFVAGTVYLIQRPGSKANPTLPTASEAAASQTAANKVAVAAGCPSSTTARVNTLHWAKAPAMTIDTSKSYTADVKTTVGSFVISLDASSAPQTVNNFVFLADHSFFHCVTFHRVIQGFVDQTGDPTGTGTGGPGYTIPDEFPPKAPTGQPQYPLGSVAMANTGKPNSGGSQWFVVVGTQGESLPNQYSLFGHVTSGMKVVQTINKDGTSTTSSSSTPNPGTPKIVQRILSVTVHHT